MIAMDCEFLWHAFFLGSDLSLRSDIYLDRFLNDRVDSKDPGCADPNPSCGNGICGVNETPINCPAVRWPTADSPPLLFQLSCLPFVPFVK